MTDRMELKTQKKEAAVTVNELLYLIFFGVMLFSKGMGWYDGMRPYQLCLLIGMGCLGLKLILTKYTPWQLLVAAVFGVLGVLSWRCSAEKGMLTCVMMLIGMKDVRIKKVFQVGAVVWSSVFLYRILAFLIGWDKGILLVHKKLGAFIFRWSMGYPHPNVFHISYVILLAFLFYLLRQKGKKLFGWIVAALVGNVLIFIYSVSFTGFLLTGIYLMLVLYFELRSQFTKPEKVLMQCVLPVGLAFSLLAPLIPEGNQFYEFMNRLMNTRLRLSKYFLTQEKITLFGQQFQLADKPLLLYLMRFIIPIIIQTDLSHRYRLRMCRLLLEPGICLLVQPVDIARMHTHGGIYVIIRLRQRECRPRRLNGRADVNHPPDSLFREPS